LDICIVLYVVLPEFSSRYQDAGENTGAQNSSEK